MFKVGDRVWYGMTANGMKTLGKIVKINPVNVKVELLEIRGAGCAQIAAGNVMTMPKAICRHERDGKWATTVG